jgi:hypothetical protein
MLIHQIGTNLASNWGWHYKLQSMCSGVVEPPHCVQMIGLNAHVGHQHSRRVPSKKIAFAFQNNCIIILQFSF